MQHGYLSAVDNDGNLLSDTLQVAHIIPRSLLSTGGHAGGALTAPQLATLSIFNMFDRRIFPLLEGTSVDQPWNRITLVGQLHEQFDAFVLSFEETTEVEAPDQPRTFALHVGNRDLRMVYPETITVPPSDSSVDPPSRVLIWMHHVVYMMMRLRDGNEDFY